MLFLQSLRLGTLEKPQARGLKSYPRLYVEVFPLLATIVNMRKVNPGAGTRMSICLKVKLMRGKKWYYADPNWLHLGTEWRLECGPEGGGRYGQGLTPQSR